MDQRAAFARARTFLEYHPVAKWSALVAAVLAGVLYVVLLMLLGLFADLAVNRGDIPAYQHLPPQQRATFRDQWKDPLAHFTPADGQALLAEYAPETEKEGEKRGGSLRPAWRKFLKDVADADPKDDAPLARAVGL